MKIYIINDIKIYDKIIIRKSDGNLLTKTHDDIPDNKEIRNIKRELIQMIKSRNAQNPIENNFKLNNN